MNGPKPGIGPESEQTPDRCVTGSWDVYAVHKGEKKLMGQRIGVWRATKLVKKIEKLGFKAETVRSGPLSSYLAQVDS